jgi:hypothetical protein
MDSKTRGAWLIHHNYKLQNVKLPSQDYDHITFAGKCGVLLNALARSNEASITNKRLEMLASANGISYLAEVPSILRELENQRLIVKHEKGVIVLGLTTSQTLEHTSKIFEESSPGKSEKAAIEVSEKISLLPLMKENASEYVSDTFNATKQETSSILNQWEAIGFFDNESIYDKKIYFNGNLFRRENINKVKALVSSLTSAEEAKVIELSAKLKSSGCIPKEEVSTMLGESLYKRLCAIGFLDENTIGNESGTYTFITQPAAFTKFSGSIADDAFDLAKALVTSLKYGMTRSPYMRGRIRMIEALMNKLISGAWVGPATAIGKDYRVLELKGVVEVKPTDGGLFKMRLLKPEIGRLALTVITEGEASTKSLLDLPSVSATSYLGPEVNREILRKKQAPASKHALGRILDALRTGELR